MLTALIAEDGRVAPAPYHKPALAVIDLRLADGDLGTGITSSCDRLAGSV